MRFVTLLAIVLSYASLALASEPDHFVRYQYAEDGFEVSFPQKPRQFKTDRGQGRGHVNSYQALVANPYSQYSVFVSHSPAKVFEDSAISAYLDGIVQGLVKAEKNPVVDFKRKTKFLGFPAIEYQYPLTIQGDLYVGRGLVFVVDGEHYRLSLVSAKDAVGMDASFKKFVDSFRLISLAGGLSKSQFNDRTRGISFSPPVGWKQGKGKFQQIAALFSNDSGHTIIILDSGVQAYVCDNYKGEIQSTQGIQDQRVITVSNRQMHWIKSSAYNQEAGIRMTSAHYCVNTSKGAVIMVGMAPETSFTRSANIFKDAASSIVVRQ